jgi:hypothetical protein
MKTAQERHLLDLATELGLSVRFQHVRVDPEGRYLTGPVGHAQAKGGITHCYVEKQAGFEGDKPVYTAIAHGQAACNPKDTYNKGIGRAIALGRAMAQVKVPA